METNTAKIVKKLKSEGWYLDDHGGNHDLYRHPTLPGPIVVTRHRTQSPGVARDIAKRAGWR